MLVQKFFDEEDFPEELRGETVAQHFVYNVMVPLVEAVNNNLPDLSEEV